MHSEDILVPELCQQSRPVRRSSSLQVLATRSRVPQERYGIYKATIVRGNLAICIIFIKSLSRDVYQEFACLHDKDINLESFLIRKIISGRLSSSTCIKWIEILFRL